MIKTLAKNSKRRSEVLANAKNIRIYRLDDNDYTSTDGMKPVSGFMPLDVQLGKVIHDTTDNTYRLSVHSNRFYDFTV